jgi:hypothetical protein
MPRGIKIMSIMSGPARAAARFGRIPDAKARSGLSRSKLYELAARNSGLFKKVDAAVIVDLEYLDRILADLPPADIKTGKVLIHEGKATT